ncbi:hypothetical protein QQZ08_011867 [Neonectria magnoliae]|uniref:Uncharacterized protein n=1 Tax=Neonectria magnoliae TaxID=2732573 RepID=A0ABR1H6Z6_9HYPO
MSLNPRQITLEKWKLNKENPRPGATTTRTSAAASLVPVLHRTVTTTRIPRTRKRTPWSYRVAGTPLRLEFEDMFLQAPVAPQTDLLLDDAFFQFYANLIWNCHGDGDVVIAADRGHQ